MFRITSLMVAAASAVLLLAPAAARATSSFTPSIDTFSGAQCQPSNGSQWADFSINPDGLRNNTDQNRYISCTMLSRDIYQIDQADGSNGSTAQGGFRFYVSFDYSQVPTASIAYVTTCTVFAKDLYYGTVASESFNTAAVRTVTPVMNNIMPASFTGYASNYFGALSFNCRLPPKVKLLGFTQVTWGDVGGWRYTP